MLACMLSIVYYWLQNAIRFLWENIMSWCAICASNQVYVSRVDSPALVFSLSSDRHSFIGLVFLFQSPTQPTVGEVCRITVDSHVWLWGKFTTQPHLWHTCGIWGRGFFLKWFTTKITLPKYNIWKEWLSEHSDSKFWVTELMFKMDNRILYPNSVTLLTCVLSTRETRWKRPSVQVKVTKSDTVPEYESSVHMVFLFFHSSPPIWSLNVVIFWSNLQHYGLYEYRRRTCGVKITHSPITLGNLPSINLVSIFRCSVCKSCRSLIFSFFFCVNSLVLGCSLS
jgi:hypothetical protein